MNQHSDNTVVRVFKTKADLAKWLGYTSIEIFNIQTGRTEENKLNYIVTYIRGG